MFYKLRNSLKTPLLSGSGGRFTRNLKSTKRRDQYFITNDTSYNENESINYNKPNKGGIMKLV